MLHDSKPLSPAQPFRSARDGFQAYGLRSRELELQIVPELGACVVSLQSRRSGREWMWQRPDGGRLFANAWGDAFERGPLVGAVECLPTIAPCTVDGVSLPDHGEAWSIAWQLDEEAFERRVIETSVRLPASGLELRRRVRLHGAAAVFEYRIRNSLPTAVPYLWAFHPLLVFEPGDRVQLPPEIQWVKVSAQHGRPHLEGQTTWRWPEPSPGVRLEEAGKSGAGAAATYSKLFADFSNSPAAWAELLRNGERLALRFDPREIPFLGLWLTDGGWNGISHLAIEPTNATTDSLAECRENVLAPFEERSWSFEIAVLDGGQ